MWEGKIDINDRNHWRIGTGGVVNGVCASCCPQSAPTGDAGADAKADEDVAVNGDIDDE